ncbi:hypothetical protein E2562_003380 [Oryza meyeriana var. granulata]|uniref:F-box associated beta-propeller type 1 domain-containing protein n=1 Tax=Oryza meyeriana var. granulata TaxID=110450 RepID=A0A6G1EF03_9ORYZ|nr:hypothetical protein E2562_003380 [Oryza meyeriana var. granulata]
MAMERATKKRCGIDDDNPAADLTNDLVVEILSRLPVKSICRFNIDGEEKEEEEEEHRLVPDPSLSFLPGYKDIIPKDGCNGLLLCLCWKESPRDESDYVVCNPATQKWLILPEIDLEKQVATIRLGFDPALSPYFLVFAILEHVDGCIFGVEIFSSETGRWSHRETGWVDEDDHMVHSDAKAAFVDGMMNFISFRSAIIAVGTEGKQ